MTEAQDKALFALQVANGKPVVLHIGIGGALVKAGKAEKLPTTGHGKLMAAYRLVAA